MDFNLSDDHLVIRDMAREFAQRELAPSAGRWDAEGSIDMSKIKSLGELGILGMLIPEEFGGNAVGNLALAIVLEELNAACASTGVTVSVHCSLTSGPLVKFGNDHIKSTYLPKMATGEWIGAYSLSEAGSGSDAGSLTCKAERDGDDWRLSGTKLWVTNGDGSDVVIIFARTDPDVVPPHRGITAFVVESSWPGFAVGKIEKKLGIRGSHTCELILTNVKVPGCNVLGEVNQGFKVAMDTLDGGRIGIAAQAIGIGRSAMEASVKFARERSQFGQIIGEFQAIQHKIAEMATRLDAARLLTHRAAWLKDLGRPHGKEAAMAKYFASTTANYCGTEAIQVHGGVGYTVEFPVERAFRDARITEIYEGTTEIQKLVIARALLRGDRH